MLVGLFPCLCVFGCSSASSFVRLGVRVFSYLLVSMFACLLFCLFRRLCVYMYVCSVDFSPLRVLVCLLARSFVCHYSVCVCVLVGQDACSYLCVCMFLFVYVCLCVCVWSCVWLCTCVFVRVFVCVVVGSSFFLFSGCSCVCVCLHYGLFDRMLRLVVCFCLSVCVCQWFVCLFLSVFLSFFVCIRVCA